LFSYGFRVRLHIPRYKASAQWNHSHLKPGLAVSSRMTPTPNVDLKKDFSHLLLNRYKSVVQVVNQKATAASFSRGRQGREKSVFGADDTAGFRFLRFTQKAEGRKPCWKSFTPSTICSHQKLNSVSPFALEEQRPPPVSTRQAVQQHPPTSTECSDLANTAEG
ncbi:hypothetical protein KUCAC02_001060, partial [Chaenocephalus aceratus]